MVMRKRGRAALAAFLTAFFVDPFAPFGVMRVDHLFSVQTWLKKQELDLWERNELTKELSG
jgi:hypothetical protein